MCSATVCKTFLPLPLPLLEKGYQWPASRLGQVRAGPERVQPTSPLGSQPQTLFLKPQTKFLKPRSNLQKQC